MEKTYYVYELINSLGTVEYVGMSENPRRRLRRHLGNKIKGNTGCGYFSGRQDLQMNIIKSFSDKPKALEYENEIQKFWGLETSWEKLSKSCKGINTGSRKSVYGIYKGKEYDFKGLQKELNLSGPHIGRIKGGSKKNVHNITFVYD